MEAIITRFGRISKKPERYEPQPDGAIVDDFSDHDDAVSDISSDVEYSDEDDLGESSSYESSFVASDEESPDGPATDTDDDS
jgi:hypothetical protein